jgi:hypothetical protein
MDTADRRVGVTGQDANAPRPGWAGREQLMAPAVVIVAALVTKTAPARTEAALTAAGSAVASPGMTAWDWLTGHHGDLAGQQAGTWRMDASD